MRRTTNQHRLPIVFTALHLPMAFPSLGATAWSVAIAEVAALNRWVELVDRLLIG